MLRGNKKGSMQDLLLAITIITAFAICTYVGYKIYLDTDDAGIFSSAEAQNALDKGGVGITRLDIGGLMIMLGFLISIVLLAFGLKIHPAFFVLGVIALVITIMIAAIYSNVFSEFKDDPEFTSVEPHFPIINTIMDYLPTWTLVMGIIILIVLYGVSRLAGD